VSFFKSYRDKVACEKTDKEYQECLITEDIIKDFKVSPSYQPVYKNLDYVTLYDTQINDVNKFKATVGDKLMYSYPYEEVKFEIGDYISWTDASKNLYDWLLIALDTQHLYRVTGEITKCNNVFRFVDEKGNLYEYPCIIRDKLIMSGLSEDKTMDIPEGRFEITLQLNEDTRKIKEDTRCLFNNVDFQDSEYGIQAVRVTNFVNMSEPKFLKMYVIKDQVNKLVDDVDNLIADKYKNVFELTIQQEDFSQSAGYTSTLTTIVTNNGNVVEADIIWSSSDDLIGTIDQLGNIELLTDGQVIFTAICEGNLDIKDEVVVDVTAVPIGVSETIIEPSDYNILQGSSKSYTVFKYVDNVAQADTFTILSSGVPSDNYDIVVGNNGFEVSNFEYYGEPLVVELTNNVTLDVTLVEINLRGFW
jgi:hypothetical protein